MGARGAWLRARPGDRNDFSDPFLKHPGSNRLRTVPDGLWLCFGGNEKDPYVDVFAIEACCSFTNLLDKRSRFAPSVHSLLAVCSVPWLLEAVTPSHAMPRWRYTGLLRSEPVSPMVLPVRDIRVMYALRPRHYEGFAASQIPHAHEYFAPVSAILGPGGWQHPCCAASSHAPPTARISGNSAPPPGWDPRAWTPPAWRPPARSPGRTFPNRPSGRFGNISE
jgi:hypothetical protein